MPVISGWFGISAGLCTVQILHYISSLLYRPLPQITNRSEIKNSNEKEEFAALASFLHKQIELKTDTKIHEMKNCLVGRNNTTDFWTDVY